MEIINLDPQNVEQLDGEELTQETQLLTVEDKLLDIIFAAEKKHGPDVHMVVELVFKSDDETDTNLCYWVEFENQTMVFETIDEVENFFLEEAVVTGDGPEVIYDNPFAEEDESTEESVKE